MARDESVALGGFFPTPPALIPSLAALISFETAASSVYRGHKHVLFDPCAGEGEAITNLRDRWWREDAYGRAMVVASEMEPTRARALAKRLPHPADQKLAADAFALTWPKGYGCSLLFLNPPYDTDPEHGRLEQRFLARFTDALAPGGALLFVLPVQALAASAKHLGRHFTSVRCWRFPDGEFEAYKQVVVIGRRTASPLVDAPMAATVEAWARFPARLLPLPSLCPDPLRVLLGDYALPIHAAAFDRIGTLAAYRPWEGLPVGVGLSVGDLGGRVFPTALPPKPAHLALALANGHFNGHRITPDARERLPPLLVKGMFTKELIEVERKLGKEGELKAIVKVQQPALRMSALRLDTFQFFEPRQGAEPTALSSLALEEFNMRDILDRYGSSFGRLMQQQFPPLHDPRRADHQMRLPDLPRKPFKVQDHAIQAALKLLATERNPKFVAEVGVGKTSCALFVWAALSPRFHAQTVAELARVGFPGAKLPVVRRMLVLCPPHLLDTWTEEILGDSHKVGCAPWARVKLVRTIADLRAEADIYVMSRENAKLGHGYRGMEGACPRCGAPLPEDAETNAAKRLRCQAPVNEPGNAWARLAEELAAAVLRNMPDNDLCVALTRRHRTLRRRAERQPSSTIDREAIRALMGHRPDVRPWPTTICDELDVALANNSAGADAWGGPIHALEQLATALGEQGMVAEALEIIAAEGKRGKERVWSPFTYAEEAAKDLRAAEARGAAERTSPEERLEALRMAVWSLQALGTWENRPEFELSRYRQRLRPPAGEEDDEPDPEVCGEPLYQAIPEPRRFPLAKYIMRYMRDRFDLLVLDELHEFSNQGTAQEKAAHRLAELHIPVLALTGSIMSGYSSSLFANWWSLDRKFREEFDRDDAQGFVKKYGFRKFVFSPREAKKGDRYGAQSDREEDMNCRSAGEVPGVLPLFLLRYLLPAGVVVHKDELDVELPAMDELQVALHAETAMDAELLAEYHRITAILVSRIAADMFTPLSGKLWGAMMELPSYLDRCTEDQGPFELRYPKDCGGMLVAEGKLFPAGYITPKERAFLAFVEAELDQERRTMAFIRHVNGGLPPRLDRLLRESGVTQKVKYLNASKVPAPTRKQWINEQVIDTETDVMIVNPNSVRTGLNNLIHFSNAWWHETDYSAQTYRQANGRLHRVGQTLPVHIRVPHYHGTAQTIAVDLVARKVTASLQVDGLSVQGALEAAGSELSGRAAVEAAMKMGQAIYERLKGK